jgi:hypothetical protein
MLALIFRAMLPRPLALAVIGFGVIDLIFMKSVTALAMLCFIAAAMVLGLRDLRLKLSITVSSVLAMALGLYVALGSGSAYDPLDRITSLSTDTSANVRYSLAKSTITAGLDAGIMGLGPGQYSRVSLAYVDQDPESLANYTTTLSRKIQTKALESKPFSLLGGVFAEFGFPMLALLLVTIFFPALKALLRRMPQAGMVFAACGAIATAFIGAVPLALPDFWLLLGLMLAAARMPSGIPVASRAPDRVDSVGSAQVWVGRAPKSA